MPQRSFKSMFVELVSFLTLFSLVGTMSSNFWERYLIQNELSNMKSSLHVLKETVHNIGTAYDNLNHELKELVQMKELKSSKTFPRQSKLSAGSDYRSSNDIDVFSNKVLEELIKLKTNKSMVTASKGIDRRPTDQKELVYAVENATTITRNPRKSTAINSEPTKLDSHSTQDNDESNDKATIVHGKIHKCCEGANCYMFPIKQ